MSVNFYAVTPDHAAAGKQGLHIGQAAANVRFLLRAHAEQGLDNWAGWPVFLRRPDVTIVSESGYTLPSRSWRRKSRGDTTPRASL
ncbi:hypothetical protein [Streptomyces sp. NPDC088748]|uniref:hypothetical protein n=1 Tax=Streptomyces sp. NPDC088748 TaxID=3365887 RepID=UPI0037FE02AD